MITVQAATDPARPDRPNEDWHGHRTNPSSLVAAVLDGVGSSGDGCVHGTPWYVNQLGAALLETASSSHRPLADALRDAITEVNCRHPWCSTDAPTAPAAAVGLVRVCRDQLEWCVLADVTVAITTAERTLQICDNRVDDVVPTATSRLGQHPLGTAEHRATAEQIVAEQLPHRNQPRGYWVAQADTHAADQAHVGSLPTSDFAEVLIATDGAMRRADWGLTTPGRILTRASNDGPDSVLRAQRAAEHDDPYGTRHPRFKDRDDATCLVVTRENA